MSKRNRAPAPKPALSPRLLFVLRGALVIAFAISMFLAWKGFTSSAIPGCGPESDCDKVLGSRWAKVFSLPVSAFAAPIYLLGFVLLSKRPIKWNFLSGLAGIILAAALWFAGLQIFALHAFCKFCMAAHIAGTVASLILLSKAPRPGKQILQSASFGAVAVALLVLVQLSNPPKGTLASYPVSSPTAQATQQTQPTTQAADPIFVTLGGEAQIDVTKVPVLGAPNGSKKVLKLFDYTCHHCRKLHQVFQPLLRQYTNLTVISLPMPLDANCNPVMKRTPAQHVNSCEYAKLGLAVYYANPAKVAEYDEWFFRFETPPSLELARKHAEDLVTAEALTKALNDPRTAQQISQDVQIYATNSRMSGGKGQMPQMLFAEGTHIGPVETTQELERILKNGIGL